MYFLLHKILKDLHQTICTDITLNISKIHKHTICFQHVKCIMSIFENSLRDCQELRYWAPIFFCQWIKSLDCFLHYCQCTLWFISRYLSPTFKRLLLKHVSHAILLTAQSLSCCHIIYDICLVVPNSSSFTQ